MWEKMIDDLEEQAMRVRRAFREWFRKPRVPGLPPTSDDTGDEEYYARAVLATAVIVSAAGAYYRCPYTETPDRLTFAEPAAWTRVERVWVDVPGASADQVKEISLDQRSSLIRDAIYAQLRPAGSPNPVPIQEWWVRDVYETYVILSQGKNNYRVDYTFDEATGQVTLGQAVAVEQQWKPVASAPGVEEEAKAGRVQASRNVARLVPAFRLIRDILVDAGYDAGKLLTAEEAEEKATAALAADTRYAIVLPADARRETIEQVRTSLSLWEKSGDRFLVLTGGAQVVPLAPPTARGEFPNPDTMITMGGEIKALGDGRIGGYLIRFSDPQHPDLAGEYFTKDTDFGPLRTSLVFFHHGKDGRIKKRILDAGAELGIDDIGVWIKAQLALRDAYERWILSRVEAKKMGWSSGTAPHLAERVTTGATTWLKTWMLGLDASVTPTPCESLNTAVPLKSFPLTESVPDLGEEDAGASCLEAKAHAAALLTLINILAQEV
ncbi:MAG: hypothetical protein WC869_10620 [Phycisphaerae bacterium]|jgi:hypothetical protein